MRPSEAKQLHRRTDGLVIDNDAFENDEDFTNFLAGAFSSIKPHLKPGGAFYIWHANNKAKSFIDAIERIGWQIRQCLIWNKNTFTLGRQDYQWKHEPCFYGWQDGAAHYFVDDRTQTTVLDESKPSKSEDHPTMKPISLFGRQIINSTRKGELVVDIFGGSGTTLIASEQLGRKCYTMELDPHYCEVILRRWEILTGKKAELSAE